MSRSTDMMNRLQPFQRKSKVYKQIFDVEAEQLDDRDTSIADLHNQLSVDTATWALDVYEKELQIPTDPSKTLDERRSVIKSKMRGTGKVGAALIKLVADSYSNGDVVVAFDGKIQITFTSLLGIPPNMTDLIKVIEEIKPAHLDVIYTFIYATFGNLEGYGITFGELEAAGLTFDQLSSWEGP